MWPSLERGPGEARPMPKLPDSLLGQAPTERARERKVLWSGKGEGTIFKVIIGVVGPADCRTLFPFSWEERGSAESVRSTMNPYPVFVASVISGSG